MPRRDDIESILIIGSGPIVIGQACEFDYSGTQACRVLRDEGYRIILANSNPATIMTDPEFADATYIEPLELDVLTAIIERERPDAILPTLGGQTALNLATELVESGVLEQYGVEMIGASGEAIATAEDRDLFRRAMEEIGLRCARSGIAHNMDEAMTVIEDIGLPVIIRPAYILGGKGTAFAHTPEEFERVAALGLEASPISEILIEQSIKGWKEFELEVMRDHADNCVVICSIENVDAMGVHTGDSITVAPAQTLSDVEYQEMRNAAFACIRRVGVETGGSNVQFAVHPETGEQVVIEMNPRVSRSSALASKATGFPIAKIAARLAVGYRLDEITNDITEKTPASFEPTIDYVVTKIPRWAFEKLPGASGVLGPQMQSVGEAMSIGRTFPESLQKGIRSLEQGRMGLNADSGEQQYIEQDTDELFSQISVPTPERLFQIAELMRRDVTIEEINGACHIDPWFLDQMQAIVEERVHLEETDCSSLSRRGWRRAKQLGFSDAQLAYLMQVDESDIRSARLAQGVAATFKTVDTCAAEFDAITPYHYSTYEDEDEIRAGQRPRMMILGSGPNRIGQGIEFDYCCVHASFALEEAGYETIMVNCNPETVSTDYDTSDRLYFEPLTLEDVLNIIDAEDPAGIIVSLGGQTPLKLASGLPDNLVCGTSPDSIDLAEDRERWNSLCAQLEIPQPPGGTAVTFEQASAICDRIGFPALVRPSYVLGGRAMTIVYDLEELREAMDDLAAFGGLGREGGLSADRPVLVDRFLEDATEVDVDSIRDHTGEFLLGGILEHVEEAGVHSGDSACAIPPPNLSSETQEVIIEYTKRLAERLEVVGLLNVQFAVKQGQVFVIEANPRASRTVPFVAKATGVQLAKVAARVMAGETLEDLRACGALPEAIREGHVAVKEAVLPFQRFPDVDTVLGPEMRSTGEVMGIDVTFGLAFAKSQIAAGEGLPLNGTIFFSLADRDKEQGLEAAKGFVEMGFEIAATEGTAKFLEQHGVRVQTVVAKLSEEGREISAGVDAVELIGAGQVKLVVNTPRGRGPRSDGYRIRFASTAHKIPCLTTVAAARAAAVGMREWMSSPLTVKPLQEFLGYEESRR
ncbi:MAG TPA: carbamoyl phosphate synthase large subunit [Acidimicrobiaceae bacterium]|nr:carbamoyl-phosphate synthase large subunit [Actinomycetota bacterium]HAQ42449.1 carbamoyl phosphate synthase large subunit [Acidimicrobiaceae bacterium]|tara:strand:+ start:8093 stop:11386 length:3294 start_codon:yes stop_codon:yes gene_type:complete